MSNEKHEKTPNKDGKELTLKQKAGKYRKRYFTECTSCTERTGLKNHR